MALSSSPVRCQFQTIKKLSLSVITAFSKKKIKFPEVQ